MQQVTLIVALTTAFAVFCLPPLWGLFLYIAAIAWYPSYLSVQIGTIDFTVCRIIILALYINLFLHSSLIERFKFGSLDKLVVIYFAAQIIAGIATTDIFRLLENRAGAMFDMMLPYFAVRFIVTGKKKFLSLLKAILFSSVPLALLGVHQCLTGIDIFSFIPGHAYVAKARGGLYRALLTFSVSIMFGLYFAMLSPVCAGLYKTVKANKWLYLWALAIMAVGVFSSMSSGPMLAALLTALFIVFYRFQRYWKTAVITLLIMCVTVEIISNRHFYDVIGRFTFSPTTAWYRSKLMDAALFEGGMSGHWLAGFGMADPGWSARIDLRSHTDIVNHYLLVLCRYGLIGLIPFLVMISHAMKILIKSFKESFLESDRWLIWCLGGTFFGLLISLFTVSLFGPPKTVFYLLLGFCTVMPVIVKETNRRFLKPSIAT